MANDSIRQLIRSMALEVLALLGEAQAPGPVQNVAQLPHLRPKARKILEAATMLPAAGKALCGRAEVDYDSDSRAVIKELFDAGLLVKGPGGYRRI